MLLVNFLFYIICTTFEPIAGLSLELFTEMGECYDMRTTNFYDVPSFSVVLDKCEIKSFGRQRISCHGEDTLKLQLFFEDDDIWCENPNMTYILDRGGCYAANSGERMITDSPTTSPTKSPVWNLLNFTANCSYDEIEVKMVENVDINNLKWTSDCYYFADRVAEAEANGTLFNDTNITCSCFGPLSWDAAWDFLNCMITPQFNGVAVWNVCNRLGYGLDDRRRSIYQSTNGNLEEINWHDTYRRLFQSLSTIDTSFAAFADIDWDLNRRQLIAIGGDEYISLTWEDDTCSDTCACSDDYNNDFGYGYLDSVGYCQCGMIMVLGLTCEGGLSGYPNQQIGNNPWAQGETSFVVDQCVRDLDSPYDGQYRKVSCINSGTALLFQFYNDDPTCANEFASATLEEMTCYNYSLLAQGTTDAPSPTPSNVPTHPPSTWPILNYTLCGDHFETVLTDYILDANLDIAEDCLALSNAIDQTEETVACPCLSQIPEWFALEHMNCNISESYHGLEVWGHCICIGYPNCIYTGTCLEDCPYYPLCPGHDGLSDCDRRRKPIERRRTYVEDTFKVMGINSQCSDFSAFPTLVPTTQRPTRSPTKTPSSSPTTPRPSSLSPTRPPTTPFPTVHPTTAHPTWGPTTGWPTLKPTSAADDASAFGVIFLEMDKRDELLLLSIMAMTLFCMIFFFWKLLFEPRSGLYDTVEEEGEEFIITDEPEPFRMSKTKEKRGPSIKFVGHD